jgi:hypothetical protein
MPRCVQASILIRADRVRDRALIAFGGGARVVRRKPGTSAQHAAAPATIKNARRSKALGGSGTVIVISGSTWTRNALQSAARSIAAKHEA